MPTSPLGRCRSNPGGAMRFASVVLFSLLAAFCLWSQATQVAQIAGTVQDSSGAAIPGAEITITNADTGISRTVQSGPEGAYLVSNLPAGPYQLRASKQGFAAYVQSGIVLQVNTNPQINV